jgi:RNA polymerase-binding transcription factor DksA
MAKKPVRSTVKSGTHKTAPQKPKTAPAKKTGGRIPNPVVRKKTASRSAAEFVPGPRTYSSEALKKFKEMILAKRQETLEELDNLKETIMDVTTGEYVSESSNYSLHMEQGTDAMEREKTFLFASRGSKFVTQLDDALVRIKDKTYGQCKVCGLLVPKERLDAVPTAQTCAEFKNTGIPCERGRLALAKLKQGK